MTETIEQYIERLRSQNVSDDEIRKNLISAGWNERDVNKVLTPPPPSHSSDSIPPPPSKGTHSMWDAFEHILLFISLYVLATSIALILHFFVDEQLPAIEVQRSYSYLTSSWKYSLLRGYNAALIVAYPLFAFFFWRVTKRTLANPSLRNLRSRKFLIYLTLVIAFIIMISNIIATIYSFLNGNLTMNFIMHIIITLVVTAVVFGYYLEQVHEDRAYE